MLLNRDGYNQDGRRLYYFDMGGDAPPPPDYTPLANASKDSAEIMAKLGEKQLAESTRQYEANSAMAAPVVAAQLGIMNQTAADAADYSNYNKTTFRPVEQGLVKDATDFSTAGAKEQFARTAAADLEGQQANEGAQSDRAMAAMGVNPNSGRFAGMKRAQTILNSGARAGATSSARVQADNLAFAKRMDVSGLGRGLPGASTGAYSVATGAGNSAVGNQMAPGGQLLNGMAQGASITGSGQQMQLTGLGSILNSQGSIFDSQLAANASARSGVMGLVGAGIGAAATAAPYLMAAASDRRLKENIVEVGTDEATGLQLYEFNYIGGAGRYRGVMADDVAPLFPDAVTYDEKGFASVNYGMLGLQMEGV